MRVLVCGGRDFADYVHVARVLDALHAAEPITLVIHGDARGADTLAKRWALARAITQLPFPAKWATHGSAAGMIRNRAMLAKGRPDLVVAFMGGRGTANMVAIARDARPPVPVLVPCDLCEGLADDRGPGCSCMHAPCVHDLTRGPNDPVRNL